MSQKRISDFFKDPVGHGSTKRQNTTNVECVSIQVSLPALPSKDHPPIRPEEESLDEPAMLTAAAPSVDSVAATCGEASTSYSLSEEPFQPKDFSFPARRFANENFSRSFKAGWFSKWPWIHYLKDTDRAVCFVCCSAMEKKLISAERMREGVFMKGGFGNWRKAGDKFREHEKSSFHLEVVSKLSALKQTSINALLSQAIAKDQVTARTVLELAFRSIKFLARQGLPLRGQEHRDGTFWQMMLERTYDLPGAREWLLRRDNWMGDNIQNEIIERLAHAVQRVVVREAFGSPYYGLIADGTTDITAKEQFSCHLFYTDDNFIQHSRFLGYYNAPDTTAETLFLCIKDVFLRLNLPLEKLKGYCFDGASNMSGRFSGVQARLGEVCQGSLFVHCCNHSLDLALQEVAREVPLISETLQFVQSAANIIRESNKRRTTFESCFGDEDARCNILGLCPTRWCVRALAVSRIICAFGPLLKTLQTLQQDVRGEMKAKISGLLKQAKKGDHVWSSLLRGPLHSLRSCG